ncbi:acyl carrier protein [Streptomyces nanhaiensis]|uniref:acyl carrier protein n=1 Tax=Streptomyces nanhaiensis TaxID=679319 RepID=UPI00399D1EF9
MTATDHAGTNTAADTAADTNTGTVDLLVAVYRETLGTAGLDRDSDFYEVGGDSLTAFQITGRIQEVLGVEVPVSLVFAYPTPADLASVVDSDFVQV